MRLRLKRYLPGLNDPHPPFLDLPSLRPFQAARELYAFAFRLMRVAPPAIYRTLPHDLSMEMLYDVALCCIKDDFQVLRSFVPSDRPFAHWLRDQFREVCPRWQDLVDGLVSPDAMQPFIRYDEKGKIHRLDPLALAHQVKDVLDACKPEDRLLLKLSVYAYRPWELHEIFRWTSMNEHQLIEHRRALKTMLADALCVSGLEVIWDDRQVNQLIRLAHTMQAVTQQPSADMVCQYRDGLLGEEARAEFISAMAGSAHLVSAVLDAIVDQWETFPDDLAVEFADVQVGCTPDYAAFLTPAPAKALDVKKIWPFQ